MQEGLALAFRAMESKAKTWAAVASAVLAMALVTLAVGCGMDHDGHDAGGGGDATGNATDAAFVNDMIPHHESAVDMARLARKQAEHPELRGLADDIITSQEKEIATMRAAKDDLGDAGHGGHMPGGEHMAGMDGAEKLAGAKPFDRAFIDEMVPHHEGAVAMAQEELAKGEHPELRELATSIIEAQRREIGQMEDWRDAWYGSGAADDTEHGMGHGG